MAVINIRDVPEVVAQAVRVEAAARGVSLREWVIETLAAGCTSRVVVGEKQGAQVSPKAQRRVREARSAKIEKEKTPIPTTEPKQAGKPADLQPCSHGLIFHPGCPDE